VAQTAVPGRSLLLPLEREKEISPSTKLLVAGKVWPRSLAHEPSGSPLGILPKEKLIVILGLHGAEGLSCVRPGSLTNPTYQLFLFLFFPKINILYTTSLVLKYKTFYILKYRCFNLLLTHMYLDALKQIYGCLLGLSARVVFILKDWDFCVISQPFIFL
jgi:hypothetical protein